MVYLRCPVASICSICTETLLNLVPVITSHDSRRVNFLWGICSCSYRHEVKTIISSLYWFRAVLIIHFSRKHFLLNSINYSFGSMMGLSSNHSLTLMLRGEQRFISIRSGVQHHLKNWQFKLNWPTIFLSIHHRILLNPTQTNFLCAHSGRATSYHYQPYRYRNDNIWSARECTIYYCTSALLRAQRTFFIIFSTNRNYILPPKTGSRL